MPDFDSWIADRTRGFDSSGIRRMFDLAAKLEDPINLSIGQPDFDVPESVKAELIQAIQDGKNGYASTQGMPVLRDKLQSETDRQFGHDDRTTFVCSGTSGGLLWLVAQACPLALILTSNSMSAKSKPRSPTKQK